ncbi:hypothetical protein STR01_49 [Streptococcus phage Str01]|nr:hypothetical protein STR01_49 [Streptococcus phage Str01]QSJ04920.1 hypothetical protein A1_22 [Streptococcus phage A1]
MEEIKLETTITKEQYDAIFGEKFDYHYFNLKRKALNRKRKEVNKMNVVIYFKNGNTAYFKDVEDYSADNLNIVFSYFGVSSQERKSATFYKDSIAGIAKTKGANNNE